VGRVVAVPWWSQSRHHQTTVSTDAIASMLIISVTGKQTVMVVMVVPSLERRETSARRTARNAPVRSCGVGSTPITVHAQPKLHVHARTSGGAGWSCTSAVAPQSERVPSSVMEQCSGEHHAGCPASAVLTGRA